MMAHSLRVQEIFTPHTATRRSPAVSSSRLRPGRRPTSIRAADEQKQAQGGRKPWDVGRFAKTVMFFNDIPTPQQVLGTIASQPLKLLQSLFSGDVENTKGAVLTVLAPQLSAQSPSSSGTSLVSSGVVMVAGATGGVGKRVVQQLLAQGCHVRALVRDIPKAKELLGSLPVAAGGKLELAPADLTQRATLLPEFFKGVRSLVVASAVTVTPKEGDTKDRKKYYQGIKFFDPEIVGDTPEAIEYQGMRNLLAASSESLGFQSGKVVLAPGAGGPMWGPLDDVVMGGISKSEIVRVAGKGEEGGSAMVFRGVVSTDNSGGFTSVRSKNFDPLLDAGAYEGLELRIKGDGQRYKMIIRTDTNWDGIAHCYSFDTQPGSWQTIRIPFSNFFPVFRARTLPDGPKLDPSSIASIQLMLSKFEYDGKLNPSFKAGNFELPIASIRTYLPEPLTPRIIHVSSAGVTRPNRPGINVDQEPPAVKLNDALGGILTWKLAAEDACRGSGVPHAIVRPVALTEEPAGAPLEIDQGDVIKGKIPRDDVAKLIVAMLQTPASANTTFEIKSTIPFSQPWTGEGGEVERDWGALLGGLKEGVTGKTVDGVYTGKEVDPTVKVLGREGKVAVKA